MKSICHSDKGGVREWRNAEGKRHREDGPAAEWVCGDKEWYIHGKRHREDGPAAEYANGNKYWYLDDKRHRVGGPAIECINGYKEWWLDGVKYNEEEYYRELYKRGLISKIQLLVELI